MDSVGDQPRTKLIGGHLLDDVVGMPLNHSVSPISKMRAHRRPGTDGVPHLLR